MLVFQHFSYEYTPGFMLDFLVFSCEYSHLRNKPTPVREWGVGGDEGAGEAGGAGGEELLIIVQCPMSNAQCPMPHAPCPMPHAP